MTDPIFFDARYIRLEHHDGISRFSSGLCAALAAKTKVVAIISNLRQLEKLPIGIDYVQLSDPTKPLSEFFIARKLNKLGAKTVFSPMQTMGSAFRKYHLVLTLHDLIYYSHPAPPPSFSPWLRFGWRLFHLTYWPQRMMLNGADKVVTVSQTTKNLIAKHKLTKRPVHVVYNAGSLSTNEKPRATPHHKLVYMGSFMDYKNVETLIAGINLLPDFELHLLSRINPKRQNELANLVTNSNQVVFHNGVTDEQYQDLIDQSFALVTASKDEGFGIPVIESMERGTPVVISDIPIFREIGGDAAVYFENENPHDFAEKIRALEAKWQEISQLSVKQSRRFSWEISADQLLKALGR